jgi:hypothetical protein
MTRIGLWVRYGELVFDGPIAIGRVKLSVDLSPGSHSAACASR